MRNQGTTAGAEPPDGHKTARCRTLAGLSSGGDLFYPADGERGLAKRRRERAAKAVCVGCPVREDCASHAIATREPHGVWGGLSERERERIWRGLDRSPYAS